jgi:acyl-homoserine-lactone acylase
MLHESQTSGPQSVGSGRALRLLIVGGLLAVAACSNESSDEAVDTDPPRTTAAPQPTAPLTEPQPPVTEPFTGYEATVTRTEHGIPHITAADWGSLGFGQGYAFAQDRACTLIDQVIKVRGERAANFGPGTDNANIDSDFAYRHLGIHRDAATRWADQPAELADMIEGYVTGFNASLVDNGAPGWCTDEAWVQPITVTDLYAYLTDVMLFASSGALIGEIATAQPPAVAPVDTAPVDTVPVTQASLDVSWPDSPMLASNGWALGAAATDNGGGLLLSNPHFPWEGEKRLWENHLTLTTGELDIYGVTLSGVPGVLIGVNDAVAWTHTVSAGNRMTLYELQLTPGDPTSYRYGDEVKAMTGTDITVEVLNDDGTTSDQTRTMWASHYGPMLNLPFGWTDTVAYTFRDANIDNTDGIGQFMAMSTATSMDEFVAAHREWNGIPWVNTVATSADGQAWYADTAAAPHLSAEAIAAWQAAVEADSTATLARDQGGAILLDGSNPINEWVETPEATRPGILPFDLQPQLLRDDYVFNANDSHWLANPNQLLIGYAPTTGREAVPQSARTRMNAILLADPQVRGDDGLMSLSELQAAFWSNRALHSELLLKGVIDACDDVNFVLVDEVPYDLTDACTVLRNWDGTYNVESSGAVLFREYLTGTSRIDRSDAGTLYDVGFDPADPVGTPNTANPNDRELLAALGAAAKAMLRDGYALDVTLGEVQYDGRAGSPTGDDGIPLGGTTGVDGGISIVDCCSGSSTSAPTGDPGQFIEGRYYSAAGYPITFGNSFVMTVTFTPDGPVAEALLTYGQPDDPTDPNYVSQMQLYSQQQFRPILLDEADIAASAEVAGTTATTLRADRPR